MNAFTISGLGIVRSGKSLLADVSLDIPQGKLVAILGPNGAGKSTLLNTLAGDIAPTTGSVQLLDKPIDHRSTKELARIRALMPQQTLLQFAFRTEEVVAMGRLPDHSRAEDAHEVTVAEAMEKAEITHLAHRIYPQLSGGEQSRASFARMLVQAAPIILLDEPTASLDIRHQQQTMAICRELVNAGGTVIAVVHDLNLAFAHADMVVLLEGGNLVATGSPWEIVQKGVLESVFECRLAIIPHPFLDCPLILLEGTDGNTEMVGRP